MSSPQLAALNLNALVALDALLSECNVTRAARRVNVTQPAMSQTLARLRELFDDPLLVRKGRGMVRSPRADAMLVPLSDALQSVERAVQLGMGFDPATSTRTFRIAMTDLHVTLVLPGALREIGVTAPHVRLQAEPMVFSGLTERIASGEVDLAVGFLLRSADGLRKETLFEDRYVCAVRRGHPLARRKRLRFSEYAEHRHLAMTPVTVVPRSMAATMGIGRTGPNSIHASSPYLLGIPSIIRETDLVATVPERIFSSPKDREGVALLEAPEELPPVPHSMWWHPRFDRDPAHQWLRALVKRQLA